MRIPGQEHIPPRWRIRTFPVLEKYRLLWVWTGDPAACGDERSIPEFLELGEAPYQSRSGLIPVEGDYRPGTSGVTVSIAEPTMSTFQKRWSQRGVAGMRGSVSSQDPASP